MSTNDKNATDHTAINAAFRVRPNRVNWVSPTSRDPDVHRQDREALNRALRRAGGKDAPEPDESEPQTFPWRSLGSEGGDDR